MDVAGIIVLGVWMRKFAIAVKSPCAINAKMNLISARDVKHLSVDVAKTT